LYWLQPICPNSLNVISQGQSRKEPESEEQKEILHTPIYAKGYYLLSGFLIFSTTKVVTTQSLQYYMLCCSSSSLITSILRATSSLFFSLAMNTTTCPTTSGFAALLPLILQWSRLVMLAYWVMSSEFHLCIRSSCGETEGKSDQR